MKERPILFNTEMVQAILDGRKTQTRRQLKPELQSLISELSYNDDHGENDPVDFGYEKHFAEDEKTILPEEWIVWLSDYKAEGCITLGQCPFGKIGDLLWVREAFLPDPECDSEHWNDEDSDHTYYSWDGCGGNPSELPIALRRPDYCIYRASCDYADEILWKPSIHMPRWASRLTLEITDIRVERLQDISEEDAQNEGIIRKRHVWSDPEYPLDDVGYLSYSNAKRIHSCPIFAFKDLWNSIYQNWDANPWVWVVEFKVV